MPDRREDQSLADLLAQLSRELLALVRQEMQYAKTEMSHNARRIGRHVGLLLVGGALVFAGFLAMLGAVVIQLGHAMPLSVAALIVGLIVAAAGSLLLNLAWTALRRDEAAPHGAMGILKEEKRWTREQTQ